MIGAGNDHRDRFQRVELDRLMGGIRLPHVRPCVVVNETAAGWVSYTHYDASGFRVKRSGASEFTSEAWGRAVAYAQSRNLPMFRSGTHQTEEES